MSATDLLARRAPLATSLRPKQEQRSTLGAVVVALRPAEWTKNLTVLAPLIFSGRFGEPALVLRSLAMFVAFCAVSSAGYLFNDLRDKPFDREHSTKRFRPIASGELDSRRAGSVAAALALVGIGGGLALGWAEAGMVILYGGLTVTYTVALKHVVIVDVMTVGACFLARVYAGGVAVDIGPSHWLVLCTAMMALFLGFAKRRQEAAGEKRSGLSSRPVLEHYSLPFLDQMVSMVTSGAVITYTLYAVNSPRIGERMLVTAPIVMYGIFRYLYLIYDRGDPRSAPELVTRDKGMIGAGLAWLVTVLVLLYT
jgi:4-hydroxybenzoate polyprenyltransferase